MYKTCPKLPPLMSCIIGCHMLVSDSFTAVSYANLPLCARYQVKVANKQTIKPNAPNLLVRLVSVLEGRLFKLACKD